MNGNELAHTSSRRGTGISRRLDGSYVAAHQHGDVAGTNVFGPDEGDVGRFHHGVRRFYRPDKAAGLDHSQRIA